MNPFADVAADTLSGPFFTLVVAISCAWCAGLGIAGTAFALGLAMRIQPQFRPLEGLAFLATPPALAFAGGLWLAEGLAMKVPGSCLAFSRRMAWPRIIAGGALAWFAAASLPGDLRAAAALIGCGLAMTVHAVRTGARMAALSAGTAPFVVPVAGVVEDCLLASTILPLAVRPPLAVVMLGIMGMAAALVAWVALPDVRRASTQVFGTAPTGSSASGDSR